MLKRLSLKLTSSVLIALILIADLSEFKETEKEPEIEIEISIFLMNFEKVNLIVSSYDQTEDILQKLLQKLDLDLGFIYYLGLFLVKKDETDTIESILKK